MATINVTKELTLSNFLQFLKIKTYLALQKIKQQYRKTHIKTECQETHDCTVMRAKRPPIVQQDVTQQLFILLLELIGRCVPLSDDQIKHDTSMKKYANNAFRIDNGTGFF